MNESIWQSWWILALRGVIGLLFGVMALAWPGLTLLWLVALFAAYALLSGVVSVIGVARAQKSDDDHRWLVLLLGLVSVGAGIIAIVHPALTALILVLIIGANALITGVLDIAVALRLRKVIRDEWLMILSGAVSILFGALVFLFPDAGALALVWMISFYAMLTGVLMLTTAFRMRSKAVETGEIRDRRITPDRRATPTHS